MKELLNKETKFIGTMMSELVFPNISFILKNSGYDFIIIDCEHGPFDYSQVAAIITAARSNGISTIVRIPEIRREPIIKYLDMGADGLLVPMVRNVADAEAVVNFVKYPPEGNRGISISRAHSKYSPGDVNEYIKKANKHTAIFIQIELTSALNEVEQIAKVPGVDAIMVGPSDLSMALGIFNQLDNPILTAAVNRTAKAASDAGKCSGVITANTTLIKNSIDAGMNIVCMGSDVRALSKGLKEAVNTVKDVF